MAYRSFTSWREGTGEGIPGRQALAVTCDTVNWFPKNHGLRAQAFVITPDQVLKLSYRGHYVQKGT